jgi:Aspartyl protease
MSTRQVPIVLALTLLTAWVVRGETRCPGNLAPIQYHSLNRSQIGVSVTINRSGPFEFQLDTGSQITVIEPSLATELHTAPEGNVGLVSGVSFAKAELARLELLQMGPYSAERSLVVVQSLAQIQLANPKVRGLLGEDFLTHFDLLIDHTHKILCLDQTKQMQNLLEGERIPMVMKPDEEWDSPYPQPLLIPVQLQGNSSPNMILRLDSGTNVPHLYVNKLETALWVQRLHAIQGHAAGTAVQYFVLMPPRDVHIGKHALSIAFATPLQTKHNVVLDGEDGLLPTSLFKRVLISYAAHLVILDPR